MFYPSPLPQPHNIPQMGSQYSHWFRGNWEYSHKKLDSPRIKRVYWPRRDTFTKADQVFKRHWNINKKCLPAIFSKDPTHFLQKIFDMPLSTPAKPRDQTRHKTHVNKPIDRRVRTLYFSHNWVCTLFWRLNYLFTSWVRLMCVMWCVWIKLIV